MEISRELFERLCVFFARLDLDLMKGGDLYLSREEVRDILLELSRENFLRPEDVVKGNLEKYGTDAVRPHISHTPPYFVHDTEHTGKLVKDTEHTWKTRDTGLEYMNNVPNDWPPAPEIGSSYFENRYKELEEERLHLLNDIKRESEHTKKLKEFSDFCDEVKSRPQYKEGTLEAELKFWRDYNDKNKD